MARRLRRALPGVHVVASVDVAPEFREYERASTAVADAYLGPVAGGYLGRLGRSAAERGLPEPDVMQSSGGVCTLAEATAHPVRLLLSGPAGGVAAVAALGAREAVSFDMGGTSTDVCLIRDGEAGRSSHRIVAGLPVRVPHVDIHTVGAGGGSIAWLDEGGALRVGPQSAGADPGPAAYGRGGRLPTVTDANVFLGRLSPAVPIAGGLRLDAVAARTALRQIGAPFRSLRAAAEGVVAVANEEMVRAIRVVSVEQGHDPRGLELVAFGGAGPLHACDVADLLGMRRVTVPAAGGVLSALGIAVGDRRTDVVESVMQPLDDVAAGAAARGGGVRASLPRPGPRADRAGRAACDPRAAVPRAPPRAVRVRRPGRRDRGRERPRVERGGRAGARASPRAAYGARSRPGIGAAGWRDDVGRRGVDGAATARRRVEDGAMIDPAGLQVLAAALRGVAEEMGAALVRSAHSANIKERRDCSTAVFDPGGRMIAQAEHLPVHLGAMPDAVAAVLACGARRGEVWAINDPYTGGTHLPDITLVAVVDDLGIVCSRAHHADVGGMQPGLNARRRHGAPPGGSRHPAHSADGRCARPPRRQHA